METKLKFKGTPGPWEIADIDDGWKDCVSARSANGNVIAVAETDNKETAEADARLIAAAPELLVALENFRMIIEWNTDLLESDTFRVAYDYANYVIRKALEEGGEE